MARSNSGGALKVAGAVAAAIVGGVTIGYLYGDVKNGGAAGQPVTPSQPVGTVSTPPAPAHAPDLRPRPTNGNYTAPNAPRIVIHEDAAPVVRRVSPATPTPPTDSEASQETGQPVLTATRQKRHGGPALPAPAVGADTPATAPTVGADTPPAPPADGTTIAPPAGNSTTPPAAPADPDFERGGGKPGDTAPPAGPDAGKAKKPQFRVQTGAYTDESSARTIADALRGQGYAAHTRSERNGDHLVYQVQAGAFRSRAGASRAAGDLQRKGFPAYVSPIAP